MEDIIRFEIIQHLGTLSEYETGWTREVNITSWNGCKHKIDIRDWSPDHTKMSKGITLNDVEAIRLAEYLITHYSYDDQ